MTDEKLDQPRNITLLPSLSDAEWREYKTGKSIRHPSL
ncbi:hypothetical protein E5S67_01494 [Microcoleus sp. IPMA8]|uniref:Uncharacterized protein n=1 Tax=Microcoleus asticus IPMA8 TaxID=2563858 RepID=A0ABX2CUH0_9CYAN|nr:hypothetical protein [Microcoleus asticus IPMA8]